MIERWRHAPTWVLSLGFGVYFGAVMTIGFAVMHGSWRAALLGGLVAGALFGAVMGPLTARRRREARHAVGDDPRVWAQAERLLRAGAPKEASDRRAAVELGEHRLAVMNGQLRWAVPTFLLVALGYSVMAVVDVSAWWLLGTGVFAGVVALSLWQRHRLRRRLHRLATTPPV